MLGRLAAYLAEEPAYYPPGADPTAVFARQIERCITFVWADPTYVRLGLWSLAEGTDPHQTDHGSGLEALIAPSEASVAAGLLHPATTCELFVATLISISIGQYGLIAASETGFPSPRPNAPDLRSRLREIAVGTLLGAFSPPRPG